jgi:flagellar biosynthetic protein FlhB
MSEDNETDDDSKTEAATQKRIDRAAEEGQVALSREAIGWFALLLATVAAATLLPTQALVVLRAMRGVLENAHDLQMMMVAGHLAEAALYLVLPVAGAAAIGATGATLLQTRGAVSANPLMPKLSKLSPLAGAKRLFSPESAIEMLRTLVKLAVVGAALWWAVGDLTGLQASLHAPAGHLIGTAGWGALRLMAAALAAFTAVAVFDLLWVRLRHLDQLRMTKQELKDEAKDSEGDPTLRARRRQLRDKMARGRMLAAVPRAAVVVTNPTHYAVALAYEGGQAAPRVVAKGVDEVAARIRAAAEGAGVPLVANPPLARALHRLDLDQEIPAEHYQAVAEIIAFVWRRRGGPSGMGLDVGAMDGGNSRDG